MTKPSEFNTKPSVATAAKPSTEHSPPGKPAEAAKTSAGSSGGKGGDIATTTKPKTVLLPTWKAIELGSVVLAPANEGAGQGWWEAVVTAINSDVLSLRWRDYPAEPVKTRRRQEVALLFPE